MKISTKNDAMTATQDVMKPLSGWVFYTDDHWYSLEKSVFHARVFDTLKDAMKAHPGFKKGAFRKVLLSEI